MKIAHLLVIGLLLPTGVFAQDRSKEPSATPAKTLEFCKADISNYCRAANLKQECLVTHWTRISSDCQDALAAPMLGGVDGAG